MDYEELQSSDLAYICRIYEAALQRGYEADYYRVEDTRTLWRIEVFYIARWDFLALLQDVSGVACRMAA